MIITNFWIILFMIGYLILKLLFLVAVHCLLIDMTMPFFTGIHPNLTSRFLGKLRLTKLAKWTRLNWNN
jgi:hypothetical protein